MDAKTLATLLDGRQMGAEINESEATIAKEHGLAVAFGYSDDNVEFRGAIDDEISAYSGADVWILNGKIIDKDEDLEVLSKYGYKPTRLVKATWCPSAPEASWLIEIETEGGEPFDIFEDDELYCRGVVFKL